MEAMEDTEATRELTDKQERFCQEYIVDLNGAQAAIRAGYSEDSAKEQASRLLTKDHIWERVQELKAESSKRAAIEADQILREIKRIATADVSHAFDPMGALRPLSEIPEDVRRCIAGLEVHELFDGAGDQKTAIGIARKIKFWDKPKALEMACKHLKLFVDRIEHSGPDGKPIQLEAKNMSDEALDARIEALLGRKPDEQRDPG